MNVCKNCDRASDINLVGLCPMCEEQWSDYLESVQKNTEYVVITREMAMDAGDPTMEGQRLTWS
jgi:hypothetical protein